MTTLVSSESPTHCQFLQFLVPLPLPHPALSSSLSSVKVAYCRSISSYVSIASVQDLPHDRTLYGDGDDELSTHYEIQRIEVIEK